MHLGCCQPRCRSRGRAPSPGAAANVSGGGPHAWPCRQCRTPSLAPDNQTPSPPGLACAGRAPVPGEFPARAAHRPGGRPRRAPRARRRSPAAARARPRRRRRRPGRPRCPAPTAAAGRVAARRPAAACTPGRAPARAGGWRPRRRRARTPAAAARLAPCACCARGPGARVRAERAGAALGDQQAAGGAARRAGRPFMRRDHVSPNDSALPASASSQGGKGGARPWLAARVGRLRRRGADRAARAGPRLRGARTRPQGGGAAAGGRALVDVDERVARLAGLPRRRERVDPEEVVVREVRAQVLALEERAERLACRAPRPPPRRAPRRRLRGRRPAA